MPWGLGSSVGLLPEYRKKLCFVGDGACGKTCLLVSASAGAFPEVYVPTVFENYVCGVQVKGKTYVQLGLWDTAGQEDYDRLRPLSYPDSHGIAICFAIDSPDSMINVLEKWYSEIDHFCKGVPIFLVGCKQDLRYDPKTIGELMKCSQWPVSTEVALKVAGLINACFYLETSAKTRFGMEKFMEIMAEELLQVTAGRRLRRPAQSASQVADAEYLFIGPGFETRLQTFPEGKHCQYDPIRPDGSAWALRSPQPDIVDSAASAALLREDGTKSPRLSRSGFFGRR
ncbi:P-loop containing nucleoside triphosphate hydrolase protein [Staphylotrichum tortipilum]|uniref:P-loop containing nucleoside triphosphate hydrolase protein n=1 Tax=Staphylotrichum tortipilum TaxID=2831512 RepID=A0AAN6MFT5_9PEZI|nr:P-loop containing nucleoside triphosphate hydrolase protein [Staphylotrichum longicolle]